MSSRPHRKERRSGTKAAARTWPRRLLRWYARHRRVLPWRSRPTPYRVWISEIMLQQTRVDTVAPYFRRFVGRFPSLPRLAAASQQEVLKAWEGLGYYARARNLHKAAQRLVAEFGGRLPADLETLRALPGIGEYTAAAIASIGHGRPAPVVDGNVLRVFTRFWGIGADIRSGSVRGRLAARLAPIVAEQPPAAFNQAVMELGALVCTPVRPACAECPLRQACVARATGRTGSLPFKSRAKPVPHHDVAVGVIWRNGRVLIAKRREDQMLGGLWEFPGGRREKRESLEHTVLREIREETGLETTCGAAYCTVKHAYTHFKITMTAFKCGYVSGTARARAAAALRWVRLPKLADYPMPRANRKVIAAIEKAQRSDAGT